MDNKITKGQILQILQEQKIDGFSGDKKTELLNKYMKYLKDVIKYFDDKQDHILKLSIFEILNERENLIKLLEVMDKINTRLSEDGGKLWDYYDKLNDDVDFHKMYLAYDKYDGIISDFKTSIEYFISDEFVKAFTKKGVV